MARFYGSERSKYGNLTGQIIIWPVEVAGDINAPSLANLLMQINAAEMSKIASISMKLWV